MEVRSDNVDGRLRSTTRENVKARDYGKHIAVVPVRDPARDAVHGARCGILFLLAKPTDRNVIFDISDRDPRAEGLLQDAGRIESLAPEALSRTAHLASEEDALVRFTHDLVA